MQSNQSQEIERSQKDNLNLDPELSQHPLFSLKNDNILSRVIQALEIRISSSPEASSLFDFQGYLKDHLFNTIFNYEGIEDLVNSGVFEANGKTICGKKLAEPGIYIRCLDCELVHEIQSSLCPECYHESDHEGHRISIVTLCDGVTATCDCGDVDVVSCSCPNHKAQEIDVKALLGKLPANLLEKYQVAIKKAFYCVVCLFEISQKASLSIIKNAVFDLATQTLNGVLDFCQRAVEEISDVFSIVTGATLQNKFLEKYDAIWHECEDFFADEDPHLVNIEQSHSCECTILANLYRIGNIMGKFEQFRVNKFILESSKVLSIKEQACVEFMKYLQFLLNQDYSSYVCIEELGTLSSELLNMIGSLCIRESTVKKLVDINCQEILIKVINKGLKKAEKIHPNLSIVVDFACRRLNDFFEKRFNTADVLVKEKNSQLELIGLLASYQNKFYYPADIYLGIESEVVDYLPIIFGIHINSNLCITLEHALAVICKFPYEQKLHYTRVFAAQWYSELLNHQLSLKTKPDKPLFSFWSGFQRIFASFVLCYLQNSITPEGVLCVFKETLPEVKANEIAENAIVGTLQALGLLRYTFIVLKSFGEVFYEMDPKTLYYNSEKDTVTLQLLLPEIDPQIVFKLLTKNFFSFCEPLCEFFENPDILIIDEPEYK